jgi:hypothetical protein
VALRGGLLARSDGTVGLPLCVIVLVTTSLPLVIQYKLKFWSRDLFNAAGTRRCALGRHSSARRRPRASGAGRSAPRLRRPRHNRNC